MPVSGVSNGSTTNMPPVQGELRKTGPNTYETDRYTFEITDGTCKVTDKTNGTSFTAWGDPHLDTSDGDNGQFHENVTFDLPDGTKLTIKTTEKDANGIAQIDSVAIMHGEMAAEITGVSDGCAGVEAGNVLQNAEAVDAKYADGTVLRAGQEVDDLTFADGSELVGTDPTAQWGEWVIDGKGGQSKYDYTGEVGGAGDAGALGGPDTVSGGGNIYAKLFAILSKIEKQFKDKVNSLDGMDPNTSEFKQAMFEIQQLQDLMSQITSTVTNLEKTDHESRMSVIRNLAA